MRLPAALPMLFRGKQSLKEKVIEKKRAQCPRYSFAAEGYENSQFDFSHGHKNQVKCAVTDITTDKSLVHS